jgi:hypothetical protein
MNTATFDDHVVPRPVTLLPEYANAKARQGLAERLTAAFRLSEAAADAIASAVVDPSDVRKAIGGADDPDVERIPVHGGTLLGLRTSVWARRTMPDPRNPRTLPARRHPFAVPPGTGGEDSRFRPLPDPEPVDPHDPRRAELAVEVENRHHLAWSAQQAAHYVLGENNWQESIASQGVMEAVWLVPTTYRHADGSAPATTLVTVEGSSRDTAVHGLLGVASADVPYDDNDAGFRAHIRRLNDRYERGDRSNEVVIQLRVERIPALILVGFEPHPGAMTGFPTAVKSLVALRHVDPPKPWGEGPENEALADEALDELCRRGLITKTQRDYYAGACTRAEAAAAHLSDDPVIRAAEIARLFLQPDDRSHEAIRIAVTSQSTRKRTTPKLMNDLATALILRAVSYDRARVDQLRRYLRHAYGKAAHRETWDATGRSTDQLVHAALAEVNQAIRDGDLSEPGPASLELAVRAAYPLVVEGRLNADRGTSNNDQPDRRTPGEVLDTMRRSPHGVLQLRQALRDYASDVHIRAVDESGQVRRLENQAETLVVSDVLLRNTFPPPGKAKAAHPGESPSDRYETAVAEMANAVDRLRASFNALSTVRGDDDQPLVDHKGLELRLAEAWRDILREVDEEVVVWARAYRRNFGPSRRAVDPVQDPAEAEDPYVDADIDADVGAADAG